MSLELRQMRHVLALAEHGTFARAASALHLSQPALSRSVQALELEMGAKLFLRSPGGTVPTDIGRVFIQRARQVVQLTADLDREVLSGRALPTGQVTVGAGPYPTESILSAALARFLGQHPGVSVRLEVRNWDELLRRLRARELDFFVAEVSTLQQERDLAIEPMSSHPFYFVARAGHPLAGRRNPTAADTFSYPFVVMSRIPPRLLEPMLAAKGQASDPRAATRAFPSLECCSLAAVKRIVGATDAIAPVTLSCVAAELADGRFTVLGSEPWMSVRYGLVTLEGQPMSQAAARFRELVLAAEREASREEERLAARRQTRGAGGRRPRRVPALRPEG